MEFLNKAVSQAADLFQSMTLGARLVAGLLLVVIVISLAYLFNTRAAGPQEYLLGAEPIPTSQISAMEQAFASAGLNEYVIEGNRIRVPGSKRNEYIAALGAANALPPNFYEVLDRAVTSTGPFTDKLTKEQLIKNARQTQLAMIIREMKGIENALVLYDTVERPGLRREQIITASVSVKPQGNQPLDEAQVPALRNIVASSIAGLDPKNVTVTDLNTNRNFHVGNNGPLGGADEDAYAQRKRLYERDWQAKIAEGLGMVPGAIVTVNVELDPQTLKRESEVQLDPRTVAVRRVESGVIQTNSTGQPGGRPGLQAQAGGPAAPLSASTQGNRSDLEETSSEETNAFGQRNTVSETAPLTPQRVKVALGIPGSYILNVWRQANPTPPGEEPQLPDQNALAQTQADVVEKLERHVANLIPQARAAQDTRPDINVTVFPDLDPQIELAEVSATAEALSWFGRNLGSFGMGLLVLLSLLLLRSMVQGSGPPEADEEAERHILPIRADLEGLGEEEQAKVEKRLRRRLENGPSLKDELADLVREDPSAAANILKTWIGTAS